MSEFTINDHILNQEARSISDEILTQAQETDDINDLIHQACDGHEWVIYTYKALKLCAECNTGEGDQLLYDTGQKFDDIGEHASALAYWTLYQAIVDCITEEAA